MYNADGSYIVFQYNANGDLLGRIEFDENGNQIKVAKSLSEEPVSEEPVSNESTKQSSADYDNSYVDEDGNLHLDFQFTFSDF